MLGVNMNSQKDNISKNNGQRLPNKRRSLLGTRSHLRKNPVADNVQLFSKTELSSTKQNESTRFLQEHDKYNKGSGEPSAGTARCLNMDSCKQPIDAMSRFFSSCEVSTPCSSTFKHDVSGIARLHEVTSQEDSAEAVARLTSFSSYKNPVRSVTESNTSRTSDLFTHRMPLNPKSSESTIDYSSYTSWLTRYNNSRIEKPPVSLSALSQLNNTTSMSNAIPVSEIGQSNTSHTIEDISKANSHMNHITKKTDTNNACDVSLNMPNASYSNNFKTSDTRSPSYIHNSELPSKLEEDSTEYFEFQESLCADKTLVANSETNKYPNYVIPVSNSVKKKLSLVFEEEEEDLASDFTSTSGRLPLKEKNVLHENSVNKPNIEFPKIKTSSSVTEILKICEKVNSLEKMKRDHDLLIQQYDESLKKMQLEKEASVNKFNSDFNMAFSTLQNLLNKMQLQADDKENSESNNQTLIEERPCHVKNSSSVLKRTLETPERLRDLSKTVFYSQMKADCSVLKTPLSSSTVKKNNCHYTPLSVRVQSQINHLFDD